LETVARFGQHCARDLQRLTRRGALSAIGRRASYAALGAVALVTALGVSGCSHDPPRPAAGQASPTTGTDGWGPPAPSLTETEPLPPPEALSEVIARLADPAVAGKDKLALVEGTSGADAGALDSFATALRDNGFDPLTVRAADVVSTKPGDVLATITVSGPDTNSGEFAFPMEFRRAGTGWQLTRQTADMLLDFGNTRTTGPASASPAPPAPARPR